MIVPNKKYILFILFLGSMIIYSNAQNKVSFKELKTNPIQNVDWTKDNSESVGPFKEILSKYNILILAESTHLDGTVYDAKCMLMKELINAGLINTIYTESSYLNIVKINSILKTEGISGISRSQYYIGSVELSYWVHNGFWDFLARKIIDGKISLVGIDIETISDTLMREILNDALTLNAVQGFINGFSEKFASLRRDFLDIRNWYTDTDYTELEFNEQKPFIDLVISSYRNTNSLDKIEQWEMILKYLYWRKHRSSMVRNKNYFEMAKDDIETSRFFSLRDSMMAEIMLKHYLNNKNTKAVVNTTSYHAQRRIWEISDIRKHVDSTSYLLGDILDKRIKGHVYNVCFVTSSGKWGRDVFVLKDIIKVKKPEKNSFEDFFRNSKHSFFFVDLENSALEDKYFTMNVLFQCYLEAPWSRIFPGVFFIKKMYPVKYFSQD